MNISWQTVAQWVTIVLTMAAMGGGIFLRVDDKLDRADNERREIKSDLRALDNLIGQRVTFVDKVIGTNEATFREFRAEVAKDLEFRRAQTIVVKDALAIMGERVARLEQGCARPGNEVKKEEAQVPGRKKMRTAGWF